MVFEVVEGGSTKMGGRMLEEFSGWSWAAVPIADLYPAIGKIFSFS